MFGFAQQKISITLTPEYTPDVTVSKASPTTNFKNEQLYITNQVVGPAHVRRVLMRFDFSSIPVGSKVDSVVLRLNRYYHPIIGGAYGNELNIYKNTSPWNGSDVTWNTLPTRKDSAIYVTKVDRIKSEEFTRMCGYFIDNPDSNFGFQLCLPNEDDSTVNGLNRNCFFYSSSNPINLRPVLDVYLSDSIASFISPNTNDTIYNFDYTTIGWLAPSTINQIRLDYTTDGVN